MKWVLNIDDDADDRELFCDALNELNAELKCITADSVQEAIRILDDNQDLPLHIFLDINMPKIDGLECLRMLKSDKRLRDVPVTVLSTACDASDIKKIEKFGAAFIRKEPTYRAYINKLKAALVACVPQDMSSSNGR